MLGPTGRRRLLFTLAALIVVAVAVRIAAPPLIRGYVNRELSHLKNYRGHVDDVDLAVWRGGCTVHGLTIAKTQSDIREPLVSAPLVDVSVQWGALMKGELVGEATLASPHVNFVRKGEETQYGEGPDWRAAIDRLLPIRLNHVRITDGTVRFRNASADPPVDVFLSDLDVEFSNLTNIRESDTPVFTGLEATATAMGHAPLTLRARLDPLREQPEFDLNFALRDLQLTRLNPLLLAYLDVTAEAGTFSVFGEVAAARGAYDGYVKPLLDHTEFLRAKDFKERPLGAIWETFVAAVAELFKNHSKDRIGTRIPVHGKFEPQPNLFVAVTGVIRNMFDAFSEGLEGSIDLRDAMKEAKKQPSG